MAKAVAFGDKPMQTIEQLSMKKGTKQSVYFGAISMAGWYAGKMVTEEEYDSAVNKFLKSGTGKG